MNKLIIALLTLELISIKATASSKYDSCFILYNLEQNKIVREHNSQNRCHERIAPNSTFKIALSLMAFDQKIISQRTIFKWDGNKGVIPEHDQNQTAQTWLQYSVVWVSQQLTPKLGMPRIKQYLADFHYGNQDFSGGLTQAWLSNSLKISAMEQLEFLKRMLTGRLSVSKSAVINTQKNAYLGKLNNGDDYFGKTGSGHHGHTTLRDGWFIGYVLHNKQHYIFVSNLTDKSPPHTTSFGGQVIKSITISLLNDYFK